MAGVASLLLDLFPDGKVRALENQHETVLVFISSEFCTQIRFAETEDRCTDCGGSLAYSEDLDDGRPCYVCCDCGAMYCS